MSKKNNDEAGLQNYIKALTEEQRWLTKILNSKNLSVEDYAARAKKAIDAAVTAICSKTTEYVNGELPEAFQEGRQRADTAIKKQSIPPPPTSNALTETKKSADTALLKASGFKYNGRALSYDTYINIQSATEAAGKGLKERINGIIDDLGKSQEDTIYNVTEAIKDDIKKNGLLNVRYSNGAQVPVDKYAAMAARSARIETANIGAFGRALENGTDYVKCTEIYPTCEICARYQGKIYCISGKDKRFPALFETALRRGYAIMHPNCRHEFVPVWLELLDDEELSKELNAAQFVGKDTRSVQERNAYARWQELNRRDNSEKLYYERAKRAMGRDFPYADIGSFRRSYRSKEGSNAHIKSHNLMRDYQQFGKYKSTMGKYAPQSFAKFREIKYNNNSGAYQALQQEYQEEKAYSIAAGGGRHSGKLRDFQKFKTAQLEKTTRSLGKAIVEHKDKVENPEKYIVKWDTLSEQERQGMIKYWNKEISNYKAQRNIARALIRRRTEE